MHHLYPTTKGDPLCPLGFHPQVRWPTRCKRCFRDYKEHGNRNKDQDSLRRDELTVSSPSLSSWSSASSRTRDDSRSDSSSNLRSWNSGAVSDALGSTASSTGSATGSNSGATGQGSRKDDSATSRFGNTSISRPATSWTSTPDLGNLNDDNVTTVSITLPRRRPQPADTGQEEDNLRSTSFTVRRRTASPAPPDSIRKSSRTSSSIPNSTNDTNNNSSDTNHSVYSNDTSTSVSNRNFTGSGLGLRSRPPLAPTPVSTSRGSKDNSRATSNAVKSRPSAFKADLKEPITNPDVEFILQVKGSKAAKGKLKEKSGKLSNSALNSTYSSSSGEDSHEDDDDISVAGTETTETTETTLVDRNESELQDQIDSLKQELETVKTRCERVEREKSDILLRRLAAMDTAPSKTAASEVLKLQQKVNELQTKSEDLQDDNKSLSLRVKELEEELNARPAAGANQRAMDELRSKLLAAETLCEELMDENEDMKRELRDMEEEMEEMQDNFREDQADEYTSLKKELEQTAKNCRILSFKLRKSERKAEAVESDKLELEKKLREAMILLRVPVVAKVAGLTYSDLFHLSSNEGSMPENQPDHRNLLGIGEDVTEKSNKIRHLEQELTLANEVSTRLQRELEEANAKLKAKEDSKDEALKRKAPMLGSLPKVGSGEKVSRETLTRGGSQDDPAQLLRDLQDSVEREADLREQLRFAEEEAQTLRKKVSRVEDDNESLVLQLKKMATKARTRRLSPTPNRLTPEPPVEKDEGISDEEDPAELRLLLELNEQEAAVLRRKVEELESDGEKLKRKVKELQDKLTAKNNRKGSVSSLSSLSESSTVPGSNPLLEKKIKVLEEETSELRKKLIEKERDSERLSAELSVSQKKGKGMLTKTKSLDGPSEQQTVDLKRQLQVIENEAMVLRQRTQTLESENEKLNAENKRLQLTRNAKNARDSSTSAKELNALKDKITALEAELVTANMKVKDLENELTKTGTKKTSVKNEDLDKMKLQVTKVTKENEKLSETLKRLKDDATNNLADFYKIRSPKKPTETTTKLQMKKMVEELEGEIGEMIVALRISEESRTKMQTGVELKEITEAKAELERDLAEARTKLMDREKKLEKERSLAEKVKKEADEIKKMADDDKAKSTKDMKKKEDDKLKVEKDRDKLKEENEKLKKDKKEIEDQISKLQSEKKASSTLAQGEMSAMAQRLEALNRQLEEEKKQNSTIKKQLDLAQKAEQDKTKLQKELSDKVKQLADVEKRLKDTEEKLKKNEGLLNTRKDKLSKMEKELEIERKTSTESANVLKAEIDRLREAQSKLLTVQTELDEVKKQLSAKNNQVEHLEACLKEERERATDATLKAGSAASREVNALREELSEAKSNISNLTEQLEKAEKSRKAVEDKMKKTEIHLQKEKDEMEKKASDLEMDLQAERKKAERNRLNQEKELKNRDTELSLLKVKLKSLESNGTNTKAAETLRQEYQQQIQALQDELAAEKQEYEDLTAKYELLEEEHVVTKSELVTEKEALAQQLQAVNSDLISVQSQLRTLQDTYTVKQDAWIKEKLDMEERMKETLEKSRRGSGNGDTWLLERQKLMAICDEKSSELEQLKREGQGLREQVDLMRRESEDLRKKLDDYEKVAEVQRRMTSDSNAKDKELRDMKNKLFQEEKTRKSEVAQLKMRYDSRVSLISEELNTLQTQVTRFKRERDTFRHMLDGAQKTISELRSNPGANKRASTASMSDESEETRSKIASLEQQVACLEDELSESRLVASKFKTELVSERSAWEVKLSEMQSKVNELEEDRLVASGRTKIPGMRTRMELAWHKEREEQTRLLQETSTLARDLRQTLFEVERERDKERLEAKRRLDQIKKSTEEEQEENRKKVMELQCDLLELRDAHAKLRTTNEKLRREKERWDRERDDLRQLASARRRTDNDDDRRLQQLLDQVEELMKLSPDMFPLRRGSSQALGTPTPPVRLKGPKSRESSPLVERKDYSREHSVAREDQSKNVQSTLQRLTEVTEELRRYQRADSQDRDRERAKRLGLRRATSTESDTAVEVPAETRSKPSVGRGGAGLQRKGSLMRKTLSLEQTSNSHEQNFWKGDDDDGSLNSLQSLDEDPRLSAHRRDNSMDSRLSGGSTQSEVLHSGDKKKKKGLLGKLTKRLTKSRSVDESDPHDLSFESLHHKEGSDVSLSTTEDPKGSKRDLKERLSGMFKKGSSSRSNSLERNAKPPPADSKQRPLLRASPAKSDTSQTSSVSRPLAPKKAVVSSSSSSSGRKAK